jgi:outer membrane biosynthesis protein TonB
MLSTTGSPGERPLRVALLWNGALQDEQLLRLPAPVVLGSGKHALFPLPEGVTTTDDVTLLEPSAGGYVLQPAPGMAGYIWRGGKPHSARGLTQPLPLAGGDYGLVTFGATSVFFQQVNPVLGVVPRKTYRDGALIACVGLSVFIHVAALVFLFLVAAQELAPAAGLELDSELLRKFLIVPPPQELLDQAAKQRSEREREQHGLRDRDESGGKKAKKEQGRVGKHDSPHEKTEIQGTPAEAVAAQVRGLGLLGVLAGGHSNAVNNVLDTPSLDNLLGGLGSAQTVLGRGSGGLSTRGGGPGGGGNANGALFGAGELGTGVGGGKGLGRGTGKGVGDGGRATHESQLSLGGGDAHVSGFLSKEQINRVVQANRAAIKYCFENALQRKPKLAGAINVEWRIDRKGIVTSTRVGKSTLDDAGVEGCILRQIKRWKFPEPDGGEVDVVYPFLFRGQ